MVKYKGKTIHPYESFYWNTTQEFFRGELGGSIARCVKCDDSLATLVMEEIKVQQVLNIVDDTNIGFKNPQRGRVYSVAGLSPCLNCCEGGGLEPKVMEPMCSVHPHSHKLEFNPETSIKDIAPALRATDYKAPPVVYEPQFLEFSNFISLETTKRTEFIEQIRGHKEMEYRIRKFTPKECFRLMGVDDEDIDKIQASGISNSSQYKLAGNSIVVDVLYHIFRKAFIEKENESQQLTFF